MITLHGQVAAGDERGRQMTPAVPVTLAHVGPMRFTNREAVFFIPYQGTEPWVVRMVGIRLDDGYLDGAMVPPQTVMPGDALRFGPGALTLSFSPSHRADYPALDPPPRARLRG